MAQQPQQPQPFDGALASTLFPSFVHLNHLATSAEGGPAAGEAGSAQEKLELSKQAAQLRTALATLQAQAANLPAGNLSLEDQDWLIEKLEGEVARKRDDLARMVQLTAQASGKTTDEDRMDTA
ncbi:hypothetical protein JCM10213_001479 [Rhodosporidiobolus nylandii]